MWTTIERSREQLLDACRAPEKKVVAPTCPTTGHKMQRDGPFEYSAYNCNGCRKSLSGKRWHCKVCRKDYCFQCRPTDISTNCNMCDARLRVTYESAPRQCHVCKELVTGKLRSCKNCHLATSCFFCFQCCPLESADIWEGTAASAMMDDPSVPADALRINSAAFESVLSQDSQPGDPVCMQSPFLPDAFKARGTGPVTLDSVTEFYIDRSKDFTNANTTLSLSQAGVKNSLSLLAHTAECRVLRCEDTMHPDCLRALVRVLSMCVCF